MPDNKASLASLRAVTSRIKNEPRQPFQYLRRDLPGFGRVIREKRFRA